MNVLAEAAKKLKSAETIAILCHINPDGDTIGCAFALYETLMAKGKQAYLFCDDNPSDRLAYIGDVSLFNACDKERFDACVAVDCSDCTRLGGKYNVLKKSGFTINIDHHGTNERFADYNIIDAKAAATAELMFELINVIDAESVNVKSAHALYCALVTDTGCFAFPSVRSETMQTASELLRFKIDAGAICYHFYKETSAEVFRLRNRILSKAKFYEDDRIGVISFDDEDFSETDTTSNDTEGIINAVIDINTVQIAIAVTKIGKMQYKVSFRTKEGIDASRCAMIFGGGGHERAAGCRINGCAEDVMEKLLKAASDNLTI